MHPPRLQWVQRLEMPVLIRRHEDIAVRTIRCAETAADAMILDHDLAMPPAVDGINGASDHAIGVRA
jgi:hypothetical protein